MGGGGHRGVWGIRGGGFSPWEGENQWECLEAVVRSFCLSGAGRMGGVPQGERYGACGEGNKTSAGADQDRRDLKCMVLGKRGCVLSAKRT